MSEPLYINVAPVTEAQVNANWRAVKELARGSLSTANKVDSPVSGLVVSAGKVKIDNFDKVADHLGNKLLAGTSITLTEGLTGGTGSKTITASLGAHQLDSSTFHTVSGLTIGHYIRAISATAFGFAAIPASEVVNTPAGNIAAVTVQAAINELDTEKTTLAAVKADADIASAISLKHAAVTVSAPIALSGQAISLVNNAVSPGTITAIDIGVVADSDTVVPTSKAVKTAIAAVVGLSDGDKGDITVSGSGTTWTIDNNAVTLAKLATQAAESILANATAGAAVPTALEIAEQTVVGRITGGHVVGLTPTQIRTLINVADGANAYVHPNHSGDVTSVADGAQTIATAAVSLAKMADLAQDKIIGRATASTGVPEAIACTAAGRALLDDASAADQRTTLGLGTMAVATATDYVAKALFDAYSVLYADSDNTPAALTVGASTLVGRGAAGGIAALSASDSRTLLGLATGDSPTFATVKLSGLTDGYVPYHVSDASGLANSNIYYDGTNVGIGTSAPASIFHVDAAAGSSTITVSSSNSSAASEFGKYQFYNSRAWYAGWGTKVMADISAVSSDDSFAEADIVFRNKRATADANPTEIMRLTHNGNVGIGTTTPASKLSINGGLHVGGDSDAGDNNILVDGTATITGAFGCNGKTAQTAYASGGAVTTSAGTYGFSSDTERANLTALVANIRAALVANGIMS